MFHLWTSGNHATWHPVSGIDSRAAPPAPILHRSGRAFGKRRDRAGALLHSLRPLARRLRHEATPAARQGRLPPRGDGTPGPCSRPTGSPVPVSHLASRYHEQASVSNYPIKLASGPDDWHAQQYCFNVYSIVLVVLNIINKTSYTLGSLDLLYRLSRSLDSIQPIAGSGCPRRSAAMTARYGSSGPEP